MANMMLRNLPDEVHDWLRAQAAQNGRSLEAEVRSILVQSVIAASSGGFGQRLRARFGRDLGGDLAVRRDAAPSEPDLFD
ncbi:Arc family DNA-binding protein [uncultured Jannaschia sp.]|uniref:FitA-like ribbon-helix-helix domain-containing protein n=1 Tax=uncultured Jannaschia sp. TaxID=293347 RepID=UPI00260484B3|nr:Arc family DNA-binding protein [uncultured Jannaschia sp.]